MRIKHKAIDCSTEMKLKLKSKAANPEGKAVKFDASPCVFRTQS
jgi:hypothetical protein